MNDRLNRLSQSFLILFITSLIKKQKHIITLILLIFIFHPIEKVQPNYKKL